MTGDDSMSDDVFEMEEDTSTALSTGLTPLTGQPTTTPSPTGYRDYKPPAEVLDNNYGYSSRDYNDIRSSFKRTKEDDSALTHKVSFMEQIANIYIYTQDDGFLLYNGLEREPFSIGKRIPTGESGFVDCERRIRAIKARFRASKQLRILLFFVLLFTRKLCYKKNLIPPFSYLIKRPYFLPTPKVPFLQSNFHPNIHIHRYPSHTWNILPFKLHFLKKKKKYLSSSEEKSINIYLYLYLAEYPEYSRHVLRSDWRGGKKGMWRGLGFDIHYRFICMMDATQCVSRMQRQQGQSCLRTKVSLLPVASRRNNDRECPRTAGTAPNTIPYVLPSTSSFYSLGPLSRGGERERETSLFPFPSSARLLPLLPLLAPCFFTAFSFQQPSSVYPFVGMLFCFVDFCFCFLFRRRATRIQRVL